MAIKTDEDLERVFGEVIEEVVVAMSDRVQKRLRQFISKDVYGLSMNANFAMGKINKSYLDGTGTPSYEFRDQAWDFNGFDSHNDWGGKKRKPYWDDFLKDLNQNIGGWLYTEFNKRGIKIPALKLYKGSFIG